MPIPALRSPRPVLLSALLFAAFSLSAAACSEDPPGSTTCPEGTREVDGECETVGRGRDAGGGDTGGGADAGDTGGGGRDAGDTGGGGGDSGGGGECAELAQRCSDTGLPQTCIDGAWADQEPCTGGDLCQAGRCLPSAECDPGEAAGCASETELRVCNGAGDAFVAQTCTSPGPYCFRGECGDQICEPGRRRCTTTNVDREVCAEDGESWLPTAACDDGAEEVCFEGECVTGCLASLKDPTYIGCEYWSVDLPQYQDPGTIIGGDPREVPHSVVLANTSDRDAEVTVETQASGVRAPGPVTVPPGGVATITFPRLDVEGTTLTNRSFRILTSRPIVAYQFNPLNDSGVFSNDASLLLPASAIGSEYYVMSWPGGMDIPNVGPQTGWFTIVATSPGVTNVEITFSANVVAGSSAPLRGITAGTTRSFPLAQWSVLNFEAQSFLRSLFPPRAEINDLTGTHIVADQNIVVFGGHEEAVIGEGDDLCCADHLEEQLFPVRSWGTRYLAAHSPPRGGGEPDVWRVMASEVGTRITTVPAIAGLDGVTLGPGDFVEVSTPLSFEVIATAPVLVAQFLLSQSVVDDYNGDPAMILAVPVEQFRDEYSLLTPGGYARDYVTVIRPAGVSITLDGTLVSAASFSPVGSGDYEIAHLPLAPGAHNLRADEPFGVVMIGYDGAVSYGYPGGLNLTPRR